MGGVVKDFRQTLIPLQVEKLWSECSRSNKQCQWTWSIHEELSEVCQGISLRQINRKFSNSKFPNVAANQWYMQVANFRINIVKLESWTFYFKRWIFKGIGRKIFPKTLFCLMLDTFFIHRLKNCIRISVGKSKTQGRRKVMGRLDYFWLFAV